MIVGTNQETSGEILKSPERCLKGQDVLLGLQTVNYVSEHALGMRRVGH